MHASLFFDIYVTFPSHETYSIEIVGPLEALCCSSTYVQFSHFIYFYISLLFVCSLCFLEHFSQSLA